MCYHQGASHARGQYHHGFNAASFHGFGRWARQFGGWQAQTDAAPVNIIEKNDWYELSVYAPGLNKDAFHVTIADDVLTIRFQGNQATDQSNWVHQEFVRQGFERRFQLNGKVDAAGITARYNEGVLELTLPKTEKAKGQQIPVG